MSSAQARGCFGNLSNGLMFDDVTLTTKKPIDKDYAERRARWEPLYEVTQMKGTGETHPSLSPTDEFADFEIWDKGSLGREAKKPEMIRTEYAREALKRGLAYEAALGTNPFKFGLIGSTDAHTSLATTTEDNYFGKVAAMEPTADPIRFNPALPPSGRARIPARRCGTPCPARRSMPPPARASGCGCSVASTSRRRTWCAPTSRGMPTRRACQWAVT
jgi:hypothetical protein